MMQNMKLTNYTITEKLIFSYKKKRKKSKKILHIICTQRKEIYCIDRQIKFVVYSLSVFNIPNFLNCM